MQKILLFPYNGNAVEALDCLDASYEFLGFVDDDAKKQGRTPEGRVVYSREAIASFPEAKILAVPGNPANFLERKKLIESLKVPSMRFVTVIHPKASISRNAAIGRNVLVMAGAVVSGGAKIGDHVCILPNTVVHHDSVVSDFTLIGSNVTIAGRVKIGSNCYIGSGSSLIQDIEIGESSMVGMASNVLRSLSAGSKVAGNPAKPLL